MEDKLISLKKSRTYKISEVMDTQPYVWAVSLNATGSENRLRKYKYNEQLSYEFNLDLNNSDPIALWYNDFQDDWIKNIGYTNTFGTIIFSSFYKKEVELFLLGMLSLRDILLDNLLYKEGVNVE